MSIFKAVRMMLPSGEVVIARTKEMLQKLLKEGGKKIKKLPDDKTRDTNIATGGGPSSPSRIILEEFYKDGGLAKKKKSKSKKSRGSGAAIKGTKFKGVF
tara:strand:- start:156 stop:455 length:300 start_codon:yes stop_codon:yes gene_type:complete